MRLFISLLVLLTLTGCGVKTQINNDSTSIQAKDIPVIASNTKPVNTVESGQGISLAEINKHSTIDDCWMAIDGKVYDFSKYTKAGDHPAGDIILQGCGLDASTMFKRVGKHSSGKTQSLLDVYLIGNLK